MFGARFHVRDITPTPPALSPASNFVNFSFLASGDPGGRVIQQRIPDDAESGEPKTP